MKEWGRAKRVLICGRCGSLIELGDLVCAFRVEGITREIYRCAKYACAEDYAPYLAPLPQPTVKPPAFKTIQSALPIGETPKERITRLLKELDDRRTAAPNRES